MRPIGLIAGLGPLAGSDVLAKMLEHAARRYGAIEDADYPDVVLISHGIADFDCKGTISPALRDDLIAMVEDVDRYGPSVVGLACNTAHLCLDVLRQHTTAPVVDLIDEVARTAAEDAHRYLLLSSSTTRATGLYRSALERYGITWIDVNDDEQATVDEVVHLVMAHALDTAASVLDELVASIAPHFTAIIAGCTELPLALDRSALPRTHRHRRFQPRPRPRAG